jgi:hypothetical protein
MSNSMNFFFITLWVTVFNNTRAYENLGAEETRALAHERSYKYDFGNSLRPR